MEHLLHYVWKHKLFPLKVLQTTNGLPVEVIDPGLQNPNAGPDFFNAKLKIDGALWVGNIEIHTHSSEVVEEKQEFVKTPTQKIRRFLYTKRNPHQANTHFSRYTGKTLSRMCSYLFMTNQNVIQYTFQ